MRNLTSGSNVFYNLGEKSNGTEVIIAAAGMAAALPGVIAATTVIPVIGVPISGSTLDGMDALFSICQMPPGIPVATVAIDGAQNAALLAAQMLAITDEGLAAKLFEMRKNQHDKVVAKDKAIDIAAILAEK